MTDKPMYYKPNGEYWFSHAYYIEEEDGRQHEFQTLEEVHNWCHENAERMLKKSFIPGMTDSIRIVHIIHWEEERE